MHNFYLPVILLILIGGYVVNVIIEKLDIHHASPILPREFEGYYDPEKYARSQSYLREKIYLGLIEGMTFTIIVTVSTLAGWFNLIDIFARSFHRGPIITGLLFFGILFTLSYMVSIPFSAVRTFVIEEKYGFNRTTRKTFTVDVIKHFILTVIVGAVMLSAVLWFFGSTGSAAWFYSWIAVTAFQIFIIFIAPVTIMPLFNKFTPLEDGELKNAIVGYAASQDFKLQGIYKMDASRRSSKSNAFFTGFGKYRRIVLYDTLIEKMKVDELVAVLAHEIGHYKHRDIFKGFTTAVLSIGLMLFMMSFFIGNRGLAAAFKMDNVSIYTGLFFFTFLYEPINAIFSVITNYITRRFESAADEFSVITYKQPEAMINALKRLSVDNLTNLTPHPIKVFLTYSHPPVMTRIEMIRRRNP